ncbi:MAG: hypothetical protein AAFV29_24100 [Myxococcota bacterium]
MASTLHDSPVNVYSFNDEFCTEKGECSCSAALSEKSCGTDLPLILVRVAAASNECVMCE